MVPQLKSVGLRVSFVGDTANTLVLCSGNCFHLDIAFNVMQLRPEIVFAKGMFRFSVCEARGMVRIPNIDRSHHRPTNKHKYSQSLIRKR